MRIRLVAGGVVLTLLAAACTAASTTPSMTEGLVASPEPTSAPLAAPPATQATPTTTLAAPTTTISPFARPDWLGTEVLPEREDGFGVIIPTPEELIDRRLLTIDLLPPPVDDTFAATVGPIPADVLARSTWKEECPVTVDELSYLTITHFGFDGRFHTGEMIVNAAVADDVVGVFRRLHEARFPIEQMRVIDEFELDLPPTGDFNDTTSFVCRPAVNSENWSQHAFGLAIDINPFHNPYLKEDLVIPELASAYLDRGDLRPGMITRGDVVFDAFAEIGWVWGGDWNSLKDWMHFSRNGR